MPRLQSACRASWAVLMIVGLGLAMALVSVWFHRSRSQRSVAYWGTHAARLLVDAPAVELWQLALGTAASADAAHASSDTTPRAANRPDGLLPPSAGNIDPGAGDGQHVVLRGRCHVVQRTIDLSAAPGMLHLRRSLLSDALYDWPDGPQVGAPAVAADAVAWRYALRFRSGQQQYVLLTDAEGWYVAGQDPRVPVLRIRPDPQGRSPLRRFIEDQIARQPPGDPPR